MFILLLTATFIFPPITLYASQTSVNSFSESNHTGDPYASGYEESTYFDGAYYTFRYGYDSSGNRFIKVENLSQGTVDVVSVDERSSTIYLNGVVLSSFINNYVEESDYRVESPTRGGYVSFKKGSSVITWGQTTSAQVIAVAIAAYLAFQYPITAVVVLSAAGAALVQIIASSITNGLVAYEMFVYQPYLNPMQWKADWSLTPQGMATVGPYPYYWTS